MKLRQIFDSIIGVLGLSDEVKAKAQAEINKLPDVEIKEAETQQTTTTATPPTHEIPKGLDADTAKLIQSLYQENKTLQASVEKLLQNEEERNKAVETQRKTEFTNKVKSTIDEAIKSGKIGAKDTAKITRYTKLLEQDFDNAKAILDEMKPLTQSTQTGGKSGGTEGEKPKMPFNGFGVKSGIADYVNKTVNSVN